MVVFDEEKHSYTNVYTGDAYTSATTLIGKFKQHFEKDKISKIVAQREGVSQQAILDRWDAINKQSLVFGNKIHKIVETYLKSRATYTTSNLEERSIIDSFNSLGSIDFSREILSEHLLFNHEYRIAGTADIIQADGAYFDVFDLKTNKKFNLFSQYNNHLKSPLDHLMECEYNVYSLQLSIYAYLYHQQTGRKLRRLAVFYYDRDANKFIEYPMAFLKKDVIEMFNYEREKAI